MSNTRLMSPRMKIALLACAASLALPAAASVADTGGVIAE